MPTPVCVPLSRSLRALVVLIGLGWGGVGWAVTCECYCDEDRDGCYSNYRATRDDYADCDTLCTDATKCQESQGTDIADGDVTTGGATVYYRDCDGDGYGDPYATESVCRQDDLTTTSDATCTNNGKWTIEGGDCNDRDGVVNSGGTEIVGDNADENCDGNCDCYIDLDGDGVGGLDAGKNPITTQSTYYKTFRPVAGSGSCSVSCDEDYTFTDTATASTVTVYLSSTTNDCDETSVDAPQRYPGNTERCEEDVTHPVDNDCDDYYNYDGYPDDSSKNEANPDDDSNAKSFSNDSDRDGYGEEENVRWLCVAGRTDGARPEDGLYSSSRNDDCNDDDLLINPGALDWCNNVDDDCDGMRDNPQFEDDLDEEISRIVTTATSVGWSNVSLKVASVSNVTTQDVRSAIGCTFASVDDDGDGQGDASMPPLCICSQPSSENPPPCGRGPTEEEREWQDDWVLCTGFLEEDFCENLSADSGSPEYKVDCTAKLSDLQLTYYVEEGDSVPFSSNTNDCDDTDEEIKLQKGVKEVMDGKDSDCSGTMPAAELDCDGDGYIVAIGDEETEASCLRGRTELISCQTTSRSGIPVEVMIECDQRSIIVGAERVNLSQWVIDLSDPVYAPMLILGTKRNHELLGGGDCDDSWAERSPGSAEICDGIDTDCDSAVNCLTLDALFGQCNSNICDDEADPDCDGYITCAINELVDEAECFEILDPDGMCVGDDGTSEGYSVVGGGDSWGYCARSVPLLAPEEELTCDGLLPPKRAHVHPAERDEDGDAHLACGPSWPESPADLGEESVFLLAYFVAEDSPDSGDSSGAEVDTSYAIPLLLPRAVESGEDEHIERRVVPSDWALQSKLLAELEPYVAAAGFDASLALAPVTRGRTFNETSEGAYDKFDPLLDLCVRAEVCHTFPESGEASPPPWCAAIPRGRCAVVELELNADGFRKDLASAPAPNGERLDSDSGDSRLSTKESTLAVAGELGVRQVWSAERILESRRRVVEWDCFVTFGTYGCGGLDATPVLGAADEELNGVLGRFRPAIDGGARGRDFVSEKQLFLLETDDAWWQEIGRFRSSATSEEAEVLSRYDDNLLSCWGDPTVDPDLGNSIAPRVGGDCADGAEDAHRDALEGPYDLRSNFIDKVAGCETCLDGLDNNCDGLMDCEDPGCAPCFIGQGSGCAGAAEGSPCASSGGCSAGRGARSPGLAVMIVLSLAALTMPLRRRGAQ